MRKWLTSTGVLAGVLAAAVAGAQNFRASIGDSVEEGLTDMVVNDLDGDGNADLIFARGLPPAGQAGSALVLYGLGDGFFECPGFCPQSLPSGNEPSALAIGDFGGDERTDIVLVDSDSSTVTVLLQVDDRTFGEPIQTTTRTCSLTAESCLIDDNCPEGQTCDERGVDSPSSVVAAFLNDDEFLDVAISSDQSQGQVAVLFGNGDGTFTPPSTSPYDTGPTTRAVVVADLNGDSRPDLVAANHDGASVSVLLNTGNGVFTAATNYASGESPVGIAIDDWNEDGATDIVVANRNDNRFAILLGNGEGGLGPPTFHPAGSFPSSVTAGDFDGDGNPDVAVGNRFSYDVTLAFGDGEGGFSQFRSFLGGVQPARIAVAFLDQDELPDVVVLDDLPDGVDEYKILARDPVATRALVALETIRTQVNPGDLSVGDINRDGVPDVVVASSSTEITVATALGGVDNSFSTTQFLAGASTSTVLLADLDVDGHPELIYARPAAAPSPTQGEGGVAQATPTAVPQVIGVSKVDATGTFGQAEVTSVGRSISSVDAADFDENGLLDIAITEGGDDRLAILLLQEDGTFAPPVRIELRPLGQEDPVFPRALVATDLDGDGHADAAVANYRDAGLLSIVYGRGDGTFENPVTIASGRRPLAVVASDVDNDGLIDVLTGNEDTNGIILHHASGPRSYEAPRTLTAGRVPMNLILRDVTGDGVRDAISADFAEDMFIVRPGGRAQSPWFNATTQLCPNFPCLPTGASPEGLGAADFNDDGTYDLVSSNSFGSNLAVALSIFENSIRRGDGNDDTFVTAADLVAVMAALPGKNRSAIEDLVRAGLVATLNLDADGDGRLTTVDSTGVVARIFR